MEEKDVNAIDKTKKEVIVDNREEMLIAYYAEDVELKELTVLNLTKIWKNKKYLVKKKRR